jgi:hypothetical protein
MHLTIADGLPLNVLLHLGSLPVLQPVLKENLNDQVTLFRLKFSCLLGRCASNITSLPLQPAGAKWLHSRPCGLPHAPPFQVPLYAFRLLSAMLSAAIHTSCVQLLIIRIRVAPGGIGVSPTNVAFAAVDDVNLQHARLTVDRWNENIYRRARGVVRQSLRTHESE